MKSKYKLFKYILVLFLIVNSFFSVALAEEPNIEIEETGETSDDSDNTPVLGGPIVPHELNTLYLEFKSRSHDNYDLNIEIEVDPFNDQTFVGSLEYTYNNQTKMLGSQDGKFNFNVSSNDMYDTYYRELVKVYGLYAGQTFKLTVKALNEKRTNITYLCQAGRVKTSNGNANSDNTVACQIRDKNDKVTDQNMINRIQIEVLNAYNTDSSIPYSIEWHTAKGEVAISCSDGNHSSRHAQIYFTDEDNILDRNDNFPIYYDFIRFKGKGHNEEGYPIVLYEKDIEHYVTSSADVFVKNSNLQIPINDTSSITPGVWNTQYAWAYRYPLPRVNNVFKIETLYDDNYKLIDYKITKYLYDGVINRISDGEEVDKLDFIIEDGLFTSLTIVNSDNPSNNDEFEYTINIQSVSDYTGPYIRWTDTNPYYEEIFSAGEDYTFTLKSGEQFTINDIEIGSHYTIREKKKDNYIATAATEFNTRDILPVALEETNDAFVAEDIELSALTIYEATDSINDPMVPEPCHPPVMDPIQFAMYWSNAKEDDFKIIVEKIAITPNGEVLGESSLKDAEFVLIGMDGSRRSLKTDENGIATFYGLDPDISYYLLEEKAPNGFEAKYDHVWYYRAEGDGRIDSLLNLYPFWNYVQIPLTKEDNTCKVTVEEKLSYVKLEARKFLLIDESRYDGPLFEIKNFSVPTNDPIQQGYIDYQDYVWPRSFFEDVECVEFTMTLDLDPDNPMYTYKAITGTNGRAFFKRELPIQPDETEEDLYKVYYGNYTIKETKTPLGMKKMEDKKVTINISGMPITDEYQSISVMKVVNLKDYSNIKLSKTIKANNIDTNKEFKFTINLYDKDNNPLTEEYTYEGSKNGTIKSGNTITLKHNESITIKDLPYDIKYEIIEEIDNKYNPKVNNIDSNKIEGTTDKELIEINYTNVSKEVPPKTRREVPNTGSK